MRALKQFYLNTAKRLYSLLLDYIAGQSVSGEVKVKKEVFKYISEDQNIYNAFMLLAIMITQLLSSLQNMEKVVKDTVSEYQLNDLEEKDLENIGQKERKLVERKHD